MTARPAPADSGAAGRALTFAENLSLLLRERVPGSTVVPVPASLLAHDGATFVEVPSRRPSRANLFQATHELAVLPELRAAASRLPGAARGVVLVEELRGPWGVPDAAACVVKAGDFAARLACGVPPLLSEQDARLVAAASGWQRREELGVAARVRGDQLRRRVGQLVRSGALVERDGRLRRDPALVPLGRLWALEAKASDWRAGLVQARGYRLWADGAVLVVGALPRDTGPLVAEADRMGLGLYGEGRWLSRPRLTLPGPARRLWASEHMLAAVRG